jgi:hypothetical protein
MLRSLGILFYEMITTKVPFNKIGEIIHKKTPILPSEFTEFDDLLGG